MRPSFITQARAFARPQRLPESATAYLKGSNDASGERDTKTSPALSTNSCSLSHVPHALRREDMPASSSTYTSHKSNDETRPTRCETSRPPASMPLRTHAPRGRLCSRHLCLNSLKSCPYPRDALPTTFREHSFPFTLGPLSHPLSLSRLQRRPALATPRSSGTLHHRASHANHSLGL